MPYATADDVKVYIDAVTLQQLTDDVGAGVIDTAEVTKTLAAQAARIDGALAGRFVVPVAAPGAFLASLCARLSVAPLYARRPMNTPPVALEAVTTGAEDDLKAVAAGRQKPPEAVPLSSESDPDAPGGIAVSSEADEGWTGDLF